MGTAANIEPGNEGEKRENLSKMSWMGEALIPIQGRGKRIVCQRDRERRIVCQRQREKDREVRDREMIILDEGGESWCKVAHEQATLTQG